MKFALVIIEPEQQLLASEQINEVFGPFDTEAEINIWIRKFEEIGDGSTKFHFLITPLREPEDPLSWLK